MTYQVEQKVKARPGWCTALGTACGIGIVGVLVLGMGVVFATAAMTQVGFAALCVAAMIALGGGWIYFLYDRES